MSLQFSFGAPSGGEVTPILPVIFTDEEGHTTPEVLAIVDTGSDGTLVPLSLLMQAGFKASRKRRHLTTVQASSLPEIVIGYEVSLKIDSLELADIDVYCSREIEDVILGRDVLNQLVFTYDGPRRMLDILMP